jgi:hypothetical protein
MFADESLGFVMVLSGKTSTARPLLERGNLTAERVGARRYQAVLLIHLAESDWLDGDRANARAQCNKANDLVDQSSFGFIGPSLFGYRAMVHDDPAERDRLLQEGEAKLGSTLAHNLSWFYRIALEVRLGERNRPAVEAMCERFLAFRPEGDPPRLHQLLVARARALALSFDDPEAGATAYATATQDLAAAGIRMPDPVELPRN